MVSPRTSPATAVAQARRQQPRRTAPPPRAVGEPGEAAGPPRPGEACPPRAPVKRRRQRAGPPPRPGPFEEPSRAALAHRRSLCPGAAAAAPQRSFVGGGRQSRPAALARPPRCEPGPPRRGAGSSHRTGRGAFSPGQLRPDPLPPTSAAGLAGGGGGGGGGRRQPEAPRKRKGRRRGQGDGAAADSPSPAAPGGAAAGGGRGWSPGRGRDPRVASLSVPAPPFPCPPLRGAPPTTAATHRAGGKRVPSVPRRLPRLSSSSCPAPASRRRHVSGAPRMPGSGTGGASLPPTAPLPLR